MLVESIDVTNQPVEMTSVVEPKMKADEPHESHGRRQDVDFLKEVLEVAQNHCHVSDVGLNFSVHDGTGRVKVDVTDKETGELIREIPSEQVLNLMAKIDEMLGILFDEKA